MPDVSHLPAAVLEARDFRSFHKEFARLPEIRLYFGLMLASASLAIWLADNLLLSLALPVVLVAIGYPGLEYILHRYVLHNVRFCRHPLTARMWWRVHYRHHSAPRDASVILGSPASLIGTAIAGGALVASFYWSYAALASGIAASFAVAIVYEYFHSLEHSRVELRNPYLLRMRRHHMAHHFVSDGHNYGITTDIVDRLIGTVVRPGGERSPTVYNLGYTDEVAARYPWVAEVEAQASDAKPDPAPAARSASSS